MLKEYHTPDSIWTAFNIHSHDEFMEKIFLGGKFHKYVPEQVVKDYQRVERVLCYAYYHYPLLDEAYSIATRIFEAAILIRLKELGLPEGGILKSKINRLEEYSSQYLIQNWQFFREVRNRFAHPDPGSLMGITLVKGFCRMINILNSIFLKKEEIQQRDLQLGQLEKLASHLAEGLYVLVTGDEVYLVYLVTPCAIVNNNSITKSLWAFQPVLVEFPQEMDKASIGDPVFKHLKDVNIGTSGMSGIDLDTNSQVQLFENTNKENLNHYTKYKEQYNTSDIVVKAFYKQHRQMEISNEIEWFLYKEAWNN